MQQDEVALVCEITPDALESFGKLQVDVFRQLKAVGFTRGYVIIDDDTFGAHGERIANFYNMIFLKGKRTLNVASELAARSFANPVYLS